MTAKEAYKKFLKSVENTDESRGEMFFTYLDINGSPTRGRFNVEVCWDAPYFDKEVKRVELFEKDQEGFQHWN